MITIVIHVLQILIAVLLVGAILLQVRTQDLGGVFGAGTSVFRARRGLRRRSFRRQSAWRSSSSCWQSPASRFTG